MVLDLTEEETDALARLLRRTIDDDRYPLSPRVQTLKAILAKDPAGTGAGAITAGEGLCEQAGDSPRMRSQPSPAVTHDNLVAAQLRLTVEYTVEY